MHLFITVLIFFSLIWTSNLHTQNPSPPSTPDNYSSSYDNLSSSGMANYIYGLYNLYNNEVDEAEKFFLKTLKTDSNSPELNFKIANFYVHTNNIKEAINYCISTLIINPYFTKAHELLASIYAATNDIKSAVEEYGKLVKRNPDNPVFKLNYGIFLLKADDIEKAKEVFKDLLDSDKSSYKVMASYYLGKIYAKIKLYNEALTYYNKAISFNPNFSQAYYDIALLYELQGNDNKSYENFLKVVDIDDNNILAREKIVRLLVKKGLLDEALEHLKKLRDLEGDSIEINIKLALIYLELKDYNNSIAILLRYKEFPKAQYYLIVSYLKLDKPDKAKEILLSIREESEYYFDSAIIFINYLIDKNKFDEALNNYLDFIGHITTKNLKIYKFGLFLFSKTKDYQKGIDFIHSAIKDFPETSEFYFYKGLFYDKLGNTEKVVESMKECLKIDPDNIDALNYLGYTYAIQNKNLDEAESLIKKAISLKPDSPSIIDSLGWVYYQKGKYKDALIYLIKAYDMSEPKDIEITIHLIKVYKKLNKKKETKKYLEEAEKLANTPELKEKLTKEMEEKSD